MIKVTYQAALCGAEGNYGVVFPDFDGCVSAGDTQAHAAEMAHEALQMHVEGMAEDGDPIPSPRRYSLEEVAAQYVDTDDPTDEDWVGMIDVTVDVPQTEDVVELQLPLTLAKDLDAAGVDRRRFIINAARRELVRLQKSA